VGFSGATTIQRLLVDQELRASLHDTVLIVDEAGMVSGRHMAALMAYAEGHAARVVFSGDTNQLQSVRGG
jgi:ATP-dependent exoDNAse (exonuclease V) alpha subunit